LVAAIAAALAERGRTPLAAWIEGAWVALGGPACLTSASELADVRSYFDLLAAHAEGADLPDRDAFVESVGKLYAAPEARADGTLQLLTMHKAKGLEFDTVILPGLNRKPRAGATQLLRWRARPGAEGGLLLAPITEQGSDADPIYAYLKTLDAAEGDHELARLLYVAATRARSELHLLAVLPEPADAKKPLAPQSRSLLDKLWPALGGAFAALPVISAETSAGARQTATLRRLPLGWTPPPRVPPPAWNAATAASESTQEAIEFSWVRETALHVGTLVHRVLMHVGREGLSQWPSERIVASRAAFATALAQLGVPQSELASAVERTIAALTRTLADERGRWLFAPDQQEAQAELALSAVVDDRIASVVLDRTFVDAQGRRWIVDFKTSAHEGGDVDAFLDSEVVRYRDSLERYAGIWRLREPGTIMLGLYFPLLGGWREWVGEESAE
jgi:ATP-dependent exoDNAse (exonuclease V) beta subunit